MSDGEFAASYPVIWDFLQTVLRPDTDGYNLFELLHRVLARYHPERAERLVGEFAQLATDRRATPQDLERVFGQELESPYLVVRAENARDIIHTLAEYLRYLRNEGLGRR